MSSVSTWIGDHPVHWVMLAIHRRRVRIIPLWNSIGVSLGKTLYFYPRSCLSGRVEQIKVAVVPENANGRIECVGVTSSQPCGKKPD